MKNFNKHLAMVLEAKGKGVFSGSIKNQDGDVECIFAAMSVVNGKIFSGALITFDSKNSIVRVENFANGTTNGHYYFKSASLTVFANHKDGVLDGDYREERSDGSSWAGQFEDGYIHGLFIKTNADGSQEKTVYSKGEIVWQG